MLKNFGSILLLIFGFIAVSCSNSPNTAKVGDVFAFDNKDKTFHIVRVIEADKSTLYVNLYSNVFNELPRNIKLEDLFISLPCRQTGADCKDGFRQVKGEFNIVPFEINNALDENWKYIENIPVSDDEKQKFTAWKTKLRGLDNR